MQELGFLVKLLKLWKLADGVLINSAIAQAENPPLMAQAINYGVKAGRKAFLAGRIKKRDFAIASSPEKNISI